MCNVECHRLLKVGYQLKKQDRMVSETEIDRAFVFTPRGQDFTCCSIVISKKIPQRGVSY